MRLERMWEDERKEEDLIITMVPGSRHFSFKYAENARFRGLLEDWRGLRKGKERKRIHRENLLNSAKRQQGFLFGYAENGRFFAVFMGMDEGDGRKGRGPCKNESYKVLNLTFYSVVSDNFKIKYKLSSAKIKLQE